MLILRRVLGVVGVGAALFSLACMIAVIGFLTGASPSDNEPAANLAAMVFFIGTMAGCTWMARWGLSQPGLAPGEPDPRSVQIRQILSLAKASAGELTHLQVATETSLSIEQSRELLEELVTEGLAQMQIDEEGVILYCFPDLRPEALDHQPRRELNP